MRARNAAGYVSSWSAMQAHICQGRPGQIVNLCRNSDFTQDLGYGTGTYPDARALRHWAAFNYLGSTVFGRNYNGGKEWNIGLGGAYQYDGATVSGAFSLPEQRVPIQPNVAYELSAYVNPHRSNCGLYLRWLDSGQSVISDAQGGPDTADAGLGILGDQYDVADRPRLWRSGTSPANAAYAEVILVKGPTTAARRIPMHSGIASCSTWPADVTKATATPWVDDALGYLRGVGDAGAVTAVGTAEWSSGGSSPIYLIFGTTAQLTITLKAGETINVEWTLEGSWGTALTYAGVGYASDIVVDGSGHTPFAITVPWSGNTQWNNQTEWKPQSSGDVFEVTRIRQYTAPADQTVTVHTGAGVRHGFSPTGAGNMLLPVFRLKV